MSDDTKTADINIRITASEKSAIQNASEIRGVPMSELIRTATLREVNKIIK